MKKYVQGHTVSKAGSQIHLERPVHQERDPGSRCTKLGAGALQPEEAHAQRSAATVTVSDKGPAWSHGPVMD